MMILRHLKFLVPCSLFAFILTVSCAQSPETKEYPGVIGDVEYDPALDDPGFRVCNVGEVFQYYNFGKVFSLRARK